MSTRQTLVVSANEIKPYISLRHDNDTNAWLAYEGIETLLLQTLSQRFNFSVSIKWANSEWGSKRKDGTWTGIIGAVVDQDADIGLGGISLTWERTEVVDFSVPYIYDYVTFVTKSPETVSPGIVIIKPFQTHLWIAVLLTLTLASLFLYFLSKVDGVKVHPFWCLFRISLQQDLVPRLVPNTVALRCFIGVWILFSFLLVMGYNSNLISVMTIPNKADPLESVAHLIEATRKKSIVVYALDKGAVLSQIMKLPDSQYKVLKDTISPCPVNECFASLVQNKGKATLIYPRSWIEAEVQRLGNGLFYIPPDTRISSLFLMLSGLVLRKHHPLLVPFNGVIRHLFESGIFKHWKKVTLLKLKQRANEEEDGEESVPEKEPEPQEDDDFGLSLIHLNSTFGLFSVGIIVSLICFAVELLIKCTIIIIYRLKYPGVSFKRRQAMHSGRGV